MIKVAIVGVGNCASSLVQGIEYYRGKSSDSIIGLMHHNLGGYKPEDIKFVTAFDIDKRKVNLDLSEAIFQRPNCTKKICDVDFMNVRVELGFLLDGVARHMLNYPEDQTFVIDEYLNDFVSDDEKEEAKERIVGILKEKCVEILINYLPVGSQHATEFYMECALSAGCAVLNCIPVFIASNTKWERRFEENGLPIIGDDIKSQIGATIVHRVLTKLFEDRGAKLDRTYQLNTGGNTDFLNMLNRDRLTSKKISKTQSVQSQLSVPLPPENIHIGPSDYVPWQKDNKVCFIRMEGRGFADAPLDLELRLSVEDSPNSAGVAIDAIRCLKLALDRKLSGALIGPSAYFMKSPPKQLPDSEAKIIVEKFIENKT
ncbi:TPA: inositol-3-phosphate synthase [bacterium]|nr:inositol-3-phosphate synthase [bacterium]